MRKQWVGVTAGVLVGLVWTVAKVSVPKLVAGRHRPGHRQGRQRGAHPATRCSSAWPLRRRRAVHRPAPLLAFREARRWSEADLRDRLFAHIQRLHFAFHDRAQTGQLMSRANTDLQQIQAFVVLIPLTISNAVTVLAVTVILCSSTRVLALLALGGLPFAQLPRQAVLDPPPPHGDGHPAGVGRAGVGRRGDGRGRAGREGLRRRGRAGRAGCATEADDVYDASMERGPGAGPRTCRRSSCCPNIGLIAVLGYGGHQVLDRQPTLGAAGGVQRLRGDADLAAAHARDDHRPGPAGGGRRPSASHEMLVDRRPRIARRPRRRPRTAAGRRRPRRGPLRGRDASATTAGRRPCSTGSTSSSPAGRVGRPGRARPAAARPPSPGSSPLLRRRRRARCCSTASTCATLRAARPAPRRSASCSRTRSCSATRIAANIAFAEPDAADERDRARPRAWPGAARVHRRAARRLRHRDRRARLLAVGRPAPAHRHRPGHPRRPPRAHPRRRHLVGRPHQGARDPRRARRGDAGPHDDRHRPPAGHDRPGRPRRAARRRAGSSPTAPTPSCSPRAPRYREVLAAAADGEPTEAGDGRRRRGRRPADVGCDGRRRSTRTDKLDAETGPCTCMRRAAAMLRPYRRHVSCARARRWSSWTAHHARRALPGQVRHRPRHQARDDGGALDAPSSATSSSPSSPTSCTACQMRADQPHRRGLPARPARPGVRPPAAAVDAVLRPREGGRDRLAA